MTELHNCTHCTECHFRSLIFENINTSDLVKLDKAKKEYLFESGETIIHEGDPIDEFIYLQNGLVKLSRRIHNGKDRIISISMPKSFVGFLTVFSEEHHKYTITALKDSILCHIDIQTMHEILRNNSELALNVLMNIRKVSDDIIYSKLNISSRQMRGRIAYLLVLFARQVFLNTRFELPITRREIGELADVSTSNVIRILSEFKREEILNIEGYIFELLKFDALERIAKFG